MVEVPVDIVGNDFKGRADQVHHAVGVVGAFDGMLTVGAARLAMKPTITVDATPEPMKTVRVKCRTRAKRRSRCWGVREWVFMRRSSAESLTPLRKRRRVAA